MKQKLINNEQEFNYFVNNLKYQTMYGSYKPFSKEDIEAIFGIRFFRTDGCVPVITNKSFWKDEFYSKDIKYLEEDTGEDFEYPFTDEFIYTRDAEKPKSFPLIAVYYFEEGFDRCGDVSVKLLHYVYLKDFKL